MKMTKINKEQIEYDYYIARLGIDQTNQLRYLAQVLGTSSLRYTLNTVIEAAYVNCDRYDRGEADYES
jgi:hypothetical protein